MPDFLQHTLLPFVEHFKSYAAWISFLAAYSETLIGLAFFVPGSTFLLFLGVLAGQGYVDIKTILIFGIAGAYLGDISNYYLGKRYGTILVKKPWLHISENLLNSTHKFLNTHGAKSIFFARFLPGFKESVPFMAGTAKMNKVKFLVWDFLGATGWSFEFIGVGYIFSTSLSLAQAWLTRTLTVVVILFFLFAILFLLKLFITRNAQAVREILLSLWQVFLANPSVKSFISSHPKLITFTKNRFNSSTFYGLPLGILTLAFVYVLALFGGIIEDFLTRDPIVYADQIIANLMVSWRTVVLNEFFTWITYLGKSEVVAVFLITATVILIIYKKIDELIALYLSFFGSLIFIYLGKIAFHRPRPEVALYLEPSFSFPSGHATIAVSLYGFIGYLLIRFTRDFKIKMNLFFAATILVLLIGISRIYLGEHYLSNVYAGYLLGILWVILAIALLKWISFKKIFARSIPFANAKSISLIAVIISFGFYLGFGMLYHYKLNPHKPEKIVRLLHVEELFKNPSKSFARNIIGLESRPINLVIATTSTNICGILKQNGWKALSAKKLLNTPIFWQAKEPKCNLYKIDTNTIYLLALWNAKAKYKAEHLFVASSGGVVGKRWDFLPKYIESNDKARTYVAKDLEKILSIHHKKIIQLVKPFVGEHLFGQSYFSDGKAIFLKQ